MIERLDCLHIFQTHMFARFIHVFEIKKNVAGFLTRNDGDPADAERWRYEPEGWHGPDSVPLYRSTELMSGQPTTLNTYLLTVTCVFAGCRDARMFLRSVGRRLLLRTHTPGPVLVETSSGQASALTFRIRAWLHLLREYAPPGHVLTRTAGTLLNFRKKVGTVPAHLSNFHAKGSFWRAISEYFECTKSTAPLRTHISNLPS